MVPREVCTHFATHTFSETFQFLLRLWLWAVRGLTPICNRTCDNYLLPISPRSSKVAKERASREHLAGSRRKHVWDSDVNIFCTVSTAIPTVEYLYPFHSNCSAVIDGKPGWRFWLCGTQGTSPGTSIYNSVNALCCWKLRLMNDASSTNVGNSVLTPSW